MTGDEHGLTDPTSDTTTDPACDSASRRFSMRAERDGSRTSLSLWLAGEIDAPERDAIVDELNAAEPPTEISIEMSGITYMGSAGLSALIHACRQLEDQGRKVVLIDPSPQVVRLLDTCGLTCQFALQLS